MTALSIEQSNKEAAALETVDIVHIGLSDFWLPRDICSAAQGQRMERNAAAQQTNQHRTLSVPSAMDTAIHASD